MLTLEDCIAHCDLSEEEIEAIAEHERVPEMIALLMGDYLVHTPEGVPCIRRMILDDIRAAEARGDKAHALRLKLVLRHFVETHGPAARKGAGTKADGGRGAARA